MITLWSFVIYASTFFCGVLLVGYLFFKERFKFWERLKVPHLPASIPTGNLQGIGRTLAFGEVLQKLHFSFPGRPFAGIYNFCRPVLLIRDPELIKAVLIKDFMTFHDRGIYVNEENDPLAAHLFSISGIKWRNLRTKLSPTFTSGKMKMMFPLIVECSEDLRSLMMEPAKSGESVDMKEIAARFTTDVISSCAFGIQTNSLNNPDSIFRVMGKKIFEANFITTIFALCTFIMPNVAKMFKARLTPKDVTKFFLSAVEETMSYREKSNVKRNDFMDLLIQLKNKGQLDDVDASQISDSKTERDVRKFTLNEAAAQAFVFFVAGFETSSTTIQFALYELSRNPEIQETAREEILRILKKYQGKITYDGVHEMEYLGRIIDETLRKYPPVPILQRESNKSYIIPNTSIVIPEGVPIQVSVLGLHHDPEYYPNPEKFDPGRFSEDEKSKRHNFSYLPFGEGPRNCIGMRFGLMQTRVGLITLLSNFKFEICQHTPNPITMNKKYFVLCPDGSMNLKVTRLPKLPNYKM